MSQTSALPLRASSGTDHQVVDSATLFETNAVLFCMCLSFVGYLIIPRGARKYFCNAYPKRFAKTYFVKHSVPTHVTTYESISDVGCISPSARSRRGCFTATGPSPLILDPRTTRVMTGQVCQTESSSVLSSPARGFTLDASNNRPGMQHLKTPLPLRIDEDSSQSPNSVLDQSMVSDTKKLLVLISSRCLDKQQEHDQNDAIELLGKRNVPFDTIDGMNGANRSRREELYKISGIRARYPQFFFVHTDDGRTTYLGDWKRLKKIHYAEGLPRGYRDANPDVSTWNQIFCDTSQIFSV